MKGTVASWWRRLLRVPVPGESGPATGPTRERSQFCFVEFEVASAPALARLTEIVDGVSADKTANTRRSDEEWLSWFLPAERAAFWWPSEREREAWNQFYRATRSGHDHDPATPMPPWDFASMIEAIYSGEYRLVGVRPTGATALLEFEPEAYPYGGTDALKELVRCFGHRIVGVDDGTGYLAGDPRPPSWHPPIDGPG